MQRGRLLKLTLVVVIGTAACQGGGGELGQTQRDPRMATTTAPSSEGTTAPRTAGSTTTPRQSPTRPTGTSASADAIPATRVGGPRSVGATAKTIIRVERGLRRTNRDAARLEKLGRAQQLAYRALAAHPDWADDVLTAAPDDLRGAVQSNIDAGSTLNQLTGSAPAPTTFPDWEILVPEPADTLRSYYRQAEQTYGIPWQYLAAIHFVETRMGRIHGNSTAGAQGPMQFIPDTWAAFGQGDINDNHDAILAAANYLQSNNAASDIDGALFRYNNDERYVAAIKAYASVMAADPGAYDGYYHWRVFYARADGTFLLPEGWSAG